MRPSEERQKALDEFVRARNKEGLVYAIQMAILAGIGVLFIGLLIK